jgi:hypothetical protein
MFVSWFRRRRLVRLLRKVWPLLNEAERAMLRRQLIWIAVHHRRPWVYWAFREFYLNISIRDT